MKICEIKEKHLLIGFVVFAKHSQSLNREANGKLSMERLKMCKRESELDKNGMDTANIYLFIFVHFWCGHFLHTCPIIISLSLFMSMRLTERERAKEIETK